MPNRVLRDWTTSEAIEKLSLGAEVFFTRLIMKADDFGNYTANDKLLKAALFPLREAHSIQSWMDECVKAGVVKKYSVEGKWYLTIPNFNQRLRAMKPQYPDISQSSDGHLHVNGRPETKRNEEKRNESEAKGKQSTTLGKGKYFIIVQPLELHSTTYRINGTDGLQEFYETNMSSISQPEFAEKFMRKYNTKKFNNFQHVWNGFNQFIENQFK